MGTLSCPSVLTSDTRRSHSRFSASAVTTWFAQRSVRPTHSEAAPPARAALVSGCGLTRFWPRYRRRHSPAAPRRADATGVDTIGCLPRDHLIPKQREPIFRRGAAPHPARLVDGRVAGVWKREQRGRRTAATDGSRLSVQLRERG